MKANTVPTARKRPLGKLILLSLLVLLTIISTACQEQAIPNPPEETPPEQLPLEDTDASQKEEEKKTPVLITYGDVIMVEDDEPYSADTYMVADPTAALTFQSGNEAVFTVAENGTLTPVSVGTTTLTVTATDENGSTTREINVTVREMWLPTDPVSLEAVSIMRNKSIPKVTLSFTDPALETEPPRETYGFECPVGIWQGHLNLAFWIPKVGENAFDATVGYDPEDMSDYDFSFKLYLQPPSECDCHADYKTISTNLVPFYIKDDADAPMYRCHFYDSGLLDIVEEGVTYRLVTVIYKGDKPVAWADTAFTWTDSCQLFTEAAEYNENTIK